MNIRIIVSSLIPGSMDVVPDSDAAKRAGKRLLYLLNALAAVNTTLWRRSYKPLYRSGITYQREAHSEDWLSLPDLYRVGYGDCEDLACARVAELRKQNRQAYPFVTWVQAPGGAWLYHVLVKRRAPDAGEYIPGNTVNAKIIRPLATEDTALAVAADASLADWWIEDPSRVLGMDGVYYPTGVKHDPSPVEPYVDPGAPHAPAPEELAPEEPSASGDARTDMVNARFAAARRGVPVYAFNANAPRFNRKGR